MEIRIDSPIHPPGNFGMVHEEKENNPPLWEGCSGNSSSLLDLVGYFA
jgi:hypothetical protein